MRAAKVIGHVVATCKYKTLEGKKMLLLQPMKWDKTPHGDPFVALDACGAGAEEFVFYVSSREAAVAFPDVPPIDAAALGIIDGLQWDAASFPEGTALSPKTEGR
ncbi:MAG TPA: EutN/CcmL family microcompartment protein [Elusimicrobiota bacterium]|nr:EutN/CcmL family microcompartment protein [Elusimicrobiota bacterium]